MGTCQLEVGLGFGDDCPSNSPGRNGLDDGSRRLGRVLGSRLGGGRLNGLFLFIGNSLTGLRSDDSGRRRTFRSRGDDSRAGYDGSRFSRNGDDDRRGSRGRS